MGLTDEAELDTIPGAQVFDAEDEPPVAPLRAAAAPMPRAARVADPQVYQTEARQGANTYPYQGEAQSAANPPPKSTAARTDEQWDAWLKKLRDACAVLYHRQEVVEVGERASVRDAIATGPQWVQREISEILHENYKRFGEEPDLPEVHIEGEELAASG